MKSYSLAIVQSHATQFDGPLFRKIAEQPSIDLTVYYLSRWALEPRYDRELNHRSGWDHDIVSGYRSCLFPASIRKRLLCVRQITKIARHDLVIVSGYNSVLRLLVAMMGKYYHTPVGLRADSVFTHRRQTWKWRLKDVLLPRLYRLYTTGHPTGSLAKAVMRHYGMSNKSLFLLPYSVDNDYLRARFEQAWPRRNHLREKMGIGPEDFVILGILKFVPREDPLTLLYAYQSIVKEFLHTHLVLVGDGALMEDILVIVKDQGVKKVHLPGYLPYSQLPEYFAIADVFVHPARIEPWGVSVNEAMVCGLPVVVADTVGAGKDLVENGKTGFIFKEGDSVSLSNRVCQLITNLELRRTISHDVVRCISKWNYEATLHDLTKALEYVGRRRSDDE